MKLFHNTSTLCRPLLKTAACMLLLALFFLHPAAAAPSADSETIVGFGHSRINSDPSAAKKEAVAGALLNTVRAAALKMIPASDISEHFELVATVIDKHRDAFIQDYRILKEFDTDKTYQVLVQATVSTRKMEKALADAGFHLTPGDLPAVLIMIAEKGIDDLGFNYWWKQGYPGFGSTTAGTVIQQALSRAGFSVISPDPDNGALDDERLASGLGAEPADYQAALLAERMGADLVVAGRAEAEALSNRMGKDVRTFKADIQLHVIDAKSGEKLTTISEKALTVSEDPEQGGRNALADAAYTAGSELSEQTISLWRNAAETREKFQIRVHGKGLLPFLERLRQAIRQHPGVSDLQTTEMTSENAVLEMKYAESAQQLGNHLLMHSFEDFGINIMEISPKSMNIEMIPE
ncbi:MAG: hypothetical protein ACOC1H_02185 [Desulfosalsimonas sp.]